MGSGNTTVPSANDVAATLRAVLDSAPALVIAWSAREPQRVGEVAMFDGKTPAVLGRAAFDVPQVEFQRQRPRAAIMTGALVAESVSRRQIVIQRIEGGGLALRNVGQARMLVNGHEVNEASVHDGDVVELRGHYVFYVAVRPVSLGDKFDWPDFEFGMPDAFGVVGESPAAWKLRSDLAFAAHAGTHVLIHGASGTGKELCAHAIHGLSSRARRTFIARNAATFPPGLIDSELFGHAKNYPTAGMPEREGLVGAVDKGTLFLDEIGEIPPELQAHLLRLLDARGEYHRLGETQTRNADIRLVCATNRTPSALKFDLVPRLKVRIALAPLEHRREDIPLIARHLLATNATATPFVRDGVADVSASLVATLLRESFPANVRELEEMLLRALQFSREPPLRLPEKRAAAVVETAPISNELDDDDVGLTETRVRAALEQSRWKVSRAADVLGVDRHVIKRLMTKYGLRDE